MQNLMSAREYTQSTAQPDLRAVWYVDADRSYSVTKRSDQDAYFIAIRTLSGTGRVELCNGKSFLPKADSLLIVDQRQILHYAAQANGWQFFWFEFTGEAITPSICEQNLTLPITAHERVTMERCFRSLNRNHVWECTLAEASFSCLLADWHLRLDQETEKGLPVSELLNLLENGRRERMSVAVMAKQAGMCERSFRDAVHKATGFSPKAYMLRGEMAAAMELLKVSTMTVSEISALFRYENPFYFSRVFKKHYGIPPQQVREGKLRKTSDEEG